MKSSNRIIAIIIGVIIIIAGAYLLFRRPATAPVSEGNATTTGSVSSTTTSGSNGFLGAGATGGYTIEPVAANNAGPMPSLSRPIYFNDPSLTEDIKTLSSEKIRSLQSSLSADPTNLAAWIDLGTYQKKIGDYSGAVESWEYAGRLAPSLYVVFGNLGDLYAYFLHDGLVAESYYKTAIAKGLDQAYLYVQYAEMARDILGDKAKAKQIVASGLSRIPTDQNLLQLKASLSQ